MAGESPWIFPSSRNPGQPVARVNNAHDRLLEQAKKGGIEVGFVLDDLRRTFATRMAEEGFDLRHSRKFSATIRSASWNAIFIRRMITRRVPRFGMKQPK